MLSAYFHCQNTACLWFGVDPAERESFERYEAEGHRFTQRFVTLVCPSCFKEELDEALPCVECSEAPAVEDGCCASCLEELIDEEANITQAVQP